MKSTDLRAKARAIFGPAIAEPMPKQPNGAKALQERANARPIPTYKDGGAIKKPVLTAAERKMGDALMMTKKGRDVMAYQDRMAAEKAKSDAEKRARADKMLGITAKKDGGKVRTSADTARALATEMGGMKKGGACMGKPAKKAIGGKMMNAVAKNPGGMLGKAISKLPPDARAKMEAGMAQSKPPRFFAKAMNNPEVAAMIGAAKNALPAMGSQSSSSARAGMDGGMPVKKAVGGAGKTRKGQAPIKRAQGGAAKVRKGMMTPTGQITPGKRCK
jgi:hypothetical protein